MNRMIRSASFHNSACSNALKRPALKLRPPVPPTLKNIEVKDDHPLWQFFSEKRFLRPVKELENIGEPWTIQQLRRKSFDDLHTIWFVCLKERNRLLRESRIHDVVAEKSNSNPFKDVAEKIRTTMWRIRHVLSERYHAEKRGRIERFENMENIVKEFSDRYLAADAGQDSEMEAQLERFQYALFDINPLLDGNSATPKILEGLKVVGNLKLTRFNPTSDAEPVLARDVNEAFIAFTAEHSPPGVQQAISSINEYRNSGTVVTEEEELNVLTRLMDSFAEEKAKNEVGQ